MIELDQMPRTPATAMAPTPPDEIAGMTLFPGAPPTGIAPALDALAPAELPNFRLEGSALRVCDWLAWLAATPGLSAALAWVIGDCTTQLARFVEASGSTIVAVKLERVSDDACRRLHHDYVAHRLVCTYRGPGTEWLPRAREAALGDERDIVPADWLRPVPRFAAALFAGRLLPGGRPVLHRSPPIAGTGQVRLVLTINEPFSGRH
jgi:hypothetical protein